MTVAVPPRPIRPDDRDERSVIGALRALIEEAWQRAQRRRQRNAAFALLGASLATVVIGFARGGMHWNAVGYSPAPGGGGAAVSYTNGKLAFAVNGGQLVVVDPDGSASVIARCRQSARGCELDDPAWSPDGTHIAYVSGSLGLTPALREKAARQNLHPTLSLYLKDAATGRVRRLAGCGYCGTNLHGVAHLGWSPDGSWIAFSRNSGPRGATSLWLVDTARGTLRRLTDYCLPQPCALSPAWSPDGQRIVFSRIADRVMALYTVRLDGSQLTKITNSAFAENPQWSPDGQRIAYDGGGVFVVDADGSDRELLSDTGAFPSWSPDGTKLAFFNFRSLPNRSSATEVWTMNPDGTAKKRLYRSVCCSSRGMAAPIWSPDGTKLAFTANSAVGTFVINRDGTGLRKVSGPTTSALTWQRLP